MNVNYVYDIFKFAAAKNGQDGYITPDEFNNAINAGQTQFLDWLLGEFQQFRYQTPTPRIQYGQTRDTRQSLTPIIYRYVLGEQPDGTWPYPGDYQEVDAMWDIYRFTPIRFAQQQFLSYYLRSVINPINTNPIYLIEDQGFRFYPNTNFNNATLPNSQALLSYVRTPPKIIWAFTLDVNDIEVYDPINSVDPIFYDVDCFEIIARALRLVGVNLQAQDVSAYAEEIKNQGQ